MRGTILAGLAALMLLAGCESRFNPINWFGGSEEEPVAAVADDAVPLDPRPLVSEVIALRVERVPGGALITAIGRAPTTGWFEAALVPEQLDDRRRPAAENGTMRFRLVAVPPPDGGFVGRPAAREISAGLNLSDQTLQGVRTITVTAAQNQRSARR